MAYPRRIWPVRLGGLVGLRLGREGLAALSFSLSGPDCSATARSSLEEDEGHQTHAYPLDAKRCGSAGHARVGISTTEVRPKAPPGSTFVPLPALPAQQGLFRVLLTPSDALFSYYCSIEECGIDILNEVESDDSIPILHP